MPMPTPVEKVPNNWGDTHIIGMEKIKIGKFEFSKEKVCGNPWFSVMLLICADPNEKQKELLKQMDVVIEDDLAQKFWPREEDVKTE